MRGITLVLSSTNHNRVEPTSDKSLTRGTNCVTIVVDRAYNEEIIVVNLFMNDNKQNERRYRRKRNSEYLTTVQIGKRYGFHPNTPGNWCRDKLIPFTKGTRGEYLLREDDVQAFIKEWYDDWADILWGQNDKAT